MRTKIFRIGGQVNANRGRPERRLSDRVSAGWSSQPNRALLALAVGGFAIGTTELVMLGLVPQVAGAFATSVPAIGYVISAYAIGVVVGAPTLTIFSVRYPRRPVLLALMGLFVIGNLGTALAPDYPVLVAARFATGLAHGAYFGTAAVVARSVVARERSVQALALVFSGLAVANVIGVPLGTALGQAGGWRWAFAAVAACGLLTVAALARWVPDLPSEPGSVRSEVTSLRQPQVLLALAVTVVGTAGLFAVYSYVTPILVQLGGFSNHAVVWVLAVYGVGTTVGTLLGGRMGDRRPMTTVIASLLAVAVVCAVFPLTVGSRAGAVLTLFVFGMAAYASFSPLQDRSMRSGGQQVLLVSAASQAAFNTANALGAFLGARVLSDGYGYKATMLVGAALASAGALIAVLAVVLERSSRAYRMPPKAPRP